jgi:site-specific recombinase XerD
MLFKKEFLAQKKSLNLKPNTLKTYEDYLTRFEAWLCEAKGVKYLQKQTITGLSTADVQKYITELKKCYSKATCMIHLATIREFYNALLHN